jgi:glyoxylase-like metal-dependent hydrolase (beta-lactamase superfamily II)
VRLIVCTHAHSDHYGQAAPIMERTGAQLWMHPNHAHMTQSASDPAAALERRLEVAAQSGVSLEAVAAFRESAKGRGYGIAEIVEPDRDLLPGVTIETDLGTWDVIETPGHAPSHVTLHQPERRLLLSGDHLLGRVSLFYDYGWTPDPAGEFLESLDKVEALDARLCLSGHGRPFTDVAGHIEANRTLVHERIEAAAATIADGPRTAVEVVPEVHGAPLTPMTGSWWLPETLCYLTWLEARGRAERVPPAAEGEPERWVGVAAT